MTGLELSGVQYLANRYRKRSERARKLWEARGLSRKHGVSWGVACRMLMGSAPPKPTVAMLRRHAASELRYWRRIRGMEPSAVCGLDDAQLGYQEAVLEGGRALAMAARILEALESQNKNS